MLLPVSTTPEPAAQYVSPGVFEVVTAESELRVLVYRGGIFARLGHNHVIAHRNIEGRIDIGDDSAGIDARLALPVAHFEVDPEALRLEEGAAFSATVSDQDKRGTRRNMLGEKLLDAANFGEISVRAREWSGELPEIRVAGEFTVRNRAYGIEFPATVRIHNGRITVTGRFVISHAQLGLVPFKAALGGLRVRDDLELKFRIVAGRVPN